MKIYLAPPKPTLAPSILLMWPSVQGSGRVSVEFEPKAQVYDLYYVLSFKHYHIISNQVIFRFLETETSSVCVDLAHCGPCTDTATFM